MSRMGIAIGKQWLSANQDVVNKFANFPTNYMGMMQRRRARALRGPVRLIDAKGKVVEEFEPMDYLDYIAGAVGGLVVPKVPVLQAAGLADRRLPRGAARRA